MLKSKEKRENKGFHPKFILSTKNLNYPKLNRDKKRTKTVAMSSKEVGLYTPIINKNYKNDISNLAFEIKKEPQSQSRALKKNKTMKIKYEQVCQIKKTNFNNCMLSTNCTDTLKDDKLYETPKYKNSCEDRKKNCLKFSDCKKTLLMVDNGNRKIIYQNNAESSDEETSELNSLFLYSKDSFIKKSEKTLKKTHEFKYRNSQKRTNSSEKEIKTIISVANSPLFKNAKKDYNKSDESKCKVKSVFKEANNKISSDNNNSLEFQNNKCDDSILGSIVGDDFYKTLLNDKGLERVNSISNFSLDSMDTIKDEEILINNNNDEMKINEISFNNVKVNEFKTFRMVNEKLSKKELIEALNSLNKTKNSQNKKINNNTNKEKCIIF